MIVLSFVWIALHSVSASHAELIGRPGCGILQMNGQPTAQNTRETGADGDLPGFRNWANEKPPAAPGSQMCASRSLSAICVISGRTVGEAGADLIVLNRGGCWWRANSEVHRVYLGTYRVRLELRPKCNAMHIGLDQPWIRTRPLAGATAATLTI
jgi:hypothetical protein